MGTVVLIIPGMPTEFIQWNMDTTMIYSWRYWNAETSPAGSKALFLKVWSTGKHYSQIHKLMHLHGNKSSRWFQCLHLSLRDCCGLGVLNLCFAEEMDSINRSRKLLRWKSIKWVLNPMPAFLFLLTQHSLHSTCTYL